MKELVNYIANHGGEAQTMVEDIMSLQALVGNESVADQVKTALENSDYVNSEDLASLQAIVDDFPNVYLTQEEAKTITACEKYEMAC